MNKAVYTVGFWSSLIAFIAVLAFDTAQFLQLTGTLTYPADQILIYGFSLLIVIPFLLSMLALHHVTRKEMKFWSHATVLFSLVYGVFVSANYVVQLATVIPMTLKGAVGEVQILSQTPHSLFWDFDAVGYICMGLAALFAVPVFKKQGFQKWVRYSFLTHACVTPLIAAVYFYPGFTNQLLLIAFPWAITAPASMLLLAIMFGKELRNGKPAGVSNLRALAAMQTTNAENESTKSATKTFLIILLAALGSGAIFGGGALILSPSGAILGMPLYLLTNSPFESFLVPGTILFVILGIAPIGVITALIKKPVYKFAERFNLYPDMYWGWTYCIYIAFALIGWIQLEMAFLRAVHWSHTLYIFLAVLILFITLLPQIRNQYKR